MPQTQDTQLALLISRLEILDQDVIDKALAAQTKAEEGGRPLPLAAVLVREGFLPYGVVERLIAHQGDTQLSCKACQTTVGAKSLDPREAFTCGSCQKTLALPEADTTLTALETLIQDPVQATKGPDLIGRSLGGCRIDRKIGEGGMGAVYAATQEYLNRTVAVKVLPEYHVHQSGFVERFLRESRSAAQVIHPNVVQVMDAGREGELHYIIMEFVPGKSLHGILEEEGRLPPHKALEYTRQAAMGLSAAAEFNIIHRDIKPDNIRINPRGVAKVADFGLAKDVQTSTQVTMTGAVVGTPLYMSPEQARGEQVDFRSDIYALGATLYHLIAGEPPFTGKSAMAILEKHTQAEVPPLSEVVKDCPPEVDNLVRKMMAKKPEERFGFYPALIKAIEEIQGRSTTMRETLFHAPAAPKKSRRLLPVVAIIVILSLIGVGAYFLTRGGGQGPSPGPVVDEGGEGGKTDEGPQAPPEVTPPPDVVEPPPVVLASAEIGSDPEGATVTLDGKVIGKTPLSLGDLAPGEGLLRLELNGYDPYEETVTLEEGRTLTRTTTLQLTVGKVRITSTPAGASVSMDGEARGETPVDLADLEPGSHEFLLEKEGYRPATQKVDLTGGENPAVAVTLDPLPATLKITTEPTGARIRIDGVYAGKSPLERGDLEPGSHRIEAELRYYDTKRWEIELAPGKTAEEGATLSRPADVETFITGVTEAEAFLEKKFRLRAWDRISQILEDVGFPKDLTSEERDRARRLVSRTGGQEPAIRFDLRFGGEGAAKLDGTSRIPTAPASAQDLAGEASTFTVRVPLPSDRAIRCCVIQFALGGELAFRLLPDEGRRTPAGATIESLGKDWSETYRRQSGDVHLLVLLASPSDIPLADVDKVKEGMIPEAEVDPIARGRGVSKALEEWLEGLDLDFSMRFLWIDERTKKQ